MQAVGTVIGADAAFAFELGAGEAEGEASGDGAAAAGSTGGAACAPPQATRDSANDQKRRFMERISIMKGQPSGTPLPT